MNDLVKAIRDLADRKYAGSASRGDLLRLQIPVPERCPGPPIIPTGELAEALEYLRKKLLEGLEDDKVAYDGMKFTFNRLEAGVAHGYIRPEHLNRMP